MSALPQTYGVVGGGQMGAGIADALLLAGAHVVLLERDADAATITQARVETAVLGGILVDWSLEDRWVVTLNRPEVATPSTPRWSIASTGCEIASRPTQGADHQRRNRDLRGKG
jgi:3-hydroxybutyryl-CoA dehydrogenase